MNREAQFLALLGATVILAIVFFGSVLHEPPKHDPCDQLVRYMTAKELKECGVGAFVTQ